MLRNTSSKLMNILFRVYLKLGNLFQPEAGHFFVGLGACGCLPSRFLKFLCL
jgi:hypothetical protein